MFFKLIVVGHWTLEKNNLVVSSLGAASSEPETASSDAKTELKAQFYNVLVGEMSLVGPRPERQHFIDLISERAPHYQHLRKVRPGITSWGQVKYGYAENVDQMVQRLRFDLIYMENMSLSLDFKILAYTVWIVLRGRGK